MASLPLQLLVVDMPPADTEPSKRYAGADWLVRYHAITMLPTVASLEVLRREGSPKANTITYLGIADPLLTGKDGSDRRAWAAEGCAASLSATTLTEVLFQAPGVPTLFRDGYADVEAVRSLAPLPETSGEVCAVAEALGSDTASLLLGSAATEGKVKSLSANGDLAKAKIVHFATHGLVSGDLGGLAEPSLVLTPPDHATEADDGLLTASEIAALNMNADWVILSACNTAAGETRDGEALSGLTRAFFYAGARAVLVSHWPVNSNAAVALTTRTFKMLAANSALSRAEALRRAMVSLIDQGGSASDPAYWAPFVLVGDGRNQTHL
jgi:CHAT domain-containing protein